MGDDYLSLVRCIQIDHKDLFPNDNLGIADRLILNNIVRKIGKEFRKGRKDKEILISYNFIKSVNDSMKEYGYKARELTNII